jgi:Flp pilus assembly protein TadG
MPPRLRCSHFALPNAIRSFFVGRDGKSGAALVEFTLFAPVVLFAAVYVIDFGLAFYAKMEVRNAALAGAQYAISTNSYDAAKISTAVSNATKFTSLTPTSSLFCGCPTASTVRFCSATTCDACNTGTCSLNTQGLYVSVTATPTGPYTPLIPAGIFASSSFNISATSTVRIR